jgi:hypothetical protein
MSWSSSTWSQQEQRSKFAEKWLPKDVVSQSGCDRVPLGNMPRKEGKPIVNFIKIAAVLAIAAAALSLGACASKPKPAPAPSSVGMSK